VNSEAGFLALFNISPTSLGYMITVQNPSSKKFLTVLAEWILEAGLLALFDTPGVDVQVIYGDTEGLDTLALAALEFLHSKKESGFSKKNIHKTSNNLFQ
jgi:hypothetical protein